MVKLAKGAKTQAKPKKAAPPPPKDMDDSDEEEDSEDESSEEEMEVPVKKTPAKKAATPAKATPGKAATPAKATVTPGKKGATPGAKNGKQAKKQESEEEEDDSDEEDQKPIKKPIAKKAVAKKEESEEDDDDEDEDESEEEKPVAKRPLAKNPPVKVTPAKKSTGKKQESDDEEDESEEEKPVAKKPPAKKPAGKKQESEDEESDEDEEEPMEVASAQKGKKTAPAKAEDDDDDDDDDDEDDDEDDEEDDDDEQQGPAKRKKEMPKNNVPEAKKTKTDTASEGFSIFIGNLNSTLDFDELKDALREFFSKKNLTIQDVRIGGTKKFGYVDFSSEEEVEKALKLSGKKILGLEVKIEKAVAFDKNKNAENKKERDSRTLFVKNIPYSTSAEELQEIFENAKDIRIPTGNDGSNKGIAYVEFSTEAEANKALEEKQGAEIEGRSLFVDFTGEKSQNSGGRRGPAGDSKVLVVNNLSYSATEDSLREVFEKATSIRIPQNQGRAKGFAFVEFSSMEDAKEAMDSCNNTEVEGRSIRLEFSQGGGPQGGGRGGSVQSKTLFVRGLSEDTTEETLKEAFDGSINARIVTDRDTGASKGFGFVDFSSAEDAKAAREAMEDGEIDGNKVTLDFAKPKGDSQRGGRGGFGGGRGGFGGRGGGRGGFGGRGGGGGRGRGGFGGRGGGGFGGGNQGQGKKIRFDD